MFTLNLPLPMFLSVIHSQLEQVNGFLFLSLPPVASFYDDQLSTEDDLDAAIAACDIQSF